MSALEAFMLMAAVMCCRVNSWPCHLPTQSSVRLCWRWRWSLLTLWEDQ